MQNPNFARIILSVGEPAGIGPDIAVKLAQHNLSCRLIVVANSELLLNRAKKLGLNLRVYTLKSEDEIIPLHQAGSLCVYNLALEAPVTPSQLDIKHVPYVLNSIKIATSFCLKAKADALVTGPVHKGIINEAGIAFSGHTELIASLCHGKDVLMMLASKQLKVALATSHIPLKDVAHSITEQKLCQKLKILHQALIQDFGKLEPKIAVCGLNPHAGENGHIGLEEINIINPAIEKMKQHGLDISGPLSADSLFAPKLAMRYDAILAMYHDQGLAPLKALYFGEIVNISLGLPIIRTSVDHGTALDIAGTNKADERSLLLAIQYAIAMTKQRKAL